MFCKKCILGCPTEEVILGLKIQMITYTTDPLSAGMQSHCMLKARQEIGMLCLRDTVQVVIVHMSLQGKRGAISSSLNWFGQVTDKDSSQPTPAKARRKRTLFLDTMQFMPQVQACCHYV